MNPKVGIMEFDEKSTSTKSFYSYSQACHIIYRLSNNNGLRLIGLLVSLHVSIVSAFAGGPRLKTTIEKFDPRARLSYLNEKSEKSSFTGKLSADSNSNITHLEQATLIASAPEKNLSTKELPQFNSTFAGRYAAISSKKEFVFYTLDPKLQEHVRGLTNRASASHVAAVVIDPKTGQILAISGKSRQLKSPELHAGYPAASLFKIVTAAAAVDTQGVNQNTVVSFRGGDYTLTQSNYLPNFKIDRRTMTVGEAMGKSCNPVFGRLALSLNSPSVLARYARSFGFNERVTNAFQLPVSYASIPAEKYELSRTGAGFGNVTISPVHAAAIIGGLATDGKLRTPYFLDKVVSPTGQIVYKHSGAVVSQMVSRRTAEELLNMMENTTTIGTSRREFMVNKRPIFPGVAIPGKTGTLRGKNPFGLTTWFIAAVPRNDPKIAVAVVAVDPKQGSAKASHLGKRIIEKVITR